MYNNIGHILVVGDEGVGKTTLLQKISDSEKSHMKETLNVHFFENSQPSNDETTSRYSGRYHYVIIMYDTSDVTTFTNILRWEKFSKIITGNNNIKFILIGNKTNKPRVVSEGTGEQMAITLNAAFLEIDALNDDAKYLIMTLLRNMAMKDYAQEFKSKTNEIRSLMNKRRQCIIL